LDKAPDAFRTISEVSHDLDVPQHVLRFWETRFTQIRPMKRGGGRRYYRPDDVDLLRGIRHLLYGEGYTIRGVQRILREQGIKFVQTIWHSGAATPEEAEDDTSSEDFSQAPASADDAAAERGRRLFSLLPSLLTQDDAAGSSEVHAAEERHEPAWASIPSTTATAHARDATPRRGLATPTPRDLALGREDLRKLQATLHELVECRRLIDAALSDAA
jgi:DNA-binding transcriptional MerR regulator